MPDDESAEQETEMSACTHPNTHMVYGPAVGGTNEYVACTSCGDRTLVAFHPST